jgi:hypothetical protein
MEVRTTQDGILRAFALLMQRQSTPQKVKQKYVHRSFGSAIHARRHLRKHEADAVNALVDQLNILDPTDNNNNERIEELLKELSAQPVKFVPLKLEQRIDRSKTYPYRSKKRGG